jgi:hypothetical protein
VISLDISGILERARLADPPSDVPVSDIPDDVSSLDGASGFDDTLPPDPKPGKVRRTKGRVSRPAAPVKATAAQKRQVADALVLLQSLLGGGIQLRDPVCGGAIVTNAEKVAEKAVPIICRNPLWLEWFTGSAGFLDVLGLAMALRPVLTTVWGHHISHTISTEEDGEPVDYSGYSAPSI